MGWVRLSDDFYDHPKFANVGPLGVAMWVAALAWCNRNLSDGFIPRAKVRTLLDFDGIAIQISQSEFSGGMADAEADHFIADLLDAGLFEPGDGGYHLHDYHDYQPTSDEVRAKQIEVSRKRSEAGRKGGQTTQTRRSGEANKQTPKQTSSIAPSKSEAPTPTPTLLAIDQQQQEHAVDAQSDPTAAAAELISEAFGILYQRRPAANSNPVRHRQVIFEGLALEHREALECIDWHVAWTPEILADWLEPVRKPHLSVVPDVGRPNYVRRDCEVCGGSGMLEVDDRTVMRCQACNAGVLGA